MTLHIGDFEGILKEELYNNFLQIKDKDNPNIIHDVQLEILITDATNEFQLFEIFHTLPRGFLKYYNVFVKMSYVQKKIIHTERFNLKDIIDHYD